MKLRVAVAALAVFACLAAACGGDDRPKAPTPVPPEELPLGTTCEPDFPPGGVKFRRPNGAEVAFRDNPFCIAWTDIFTDETGYKVVLRVGTGEFVYVTPPNVNEVYPPQDVWPFTAGKGDVQIMVYGITPRGEEVVEGMARTVN